MRTRTHALAAVAAVLALLAANPVGARLARGFPDPSFGRYGAVQTNFGSYDFGAAVSVQADGKILAAGSTNDKVALARYIANGRPDRSFSKDGKTTLSLEAPAAASSIAPAPGGKVVVAGTQYRYLSEEQCCQYGVVVARLTRSGALDGTFGDGGSVVMEIPSSGTRAGIFGGALAVRPDGSIIVGGSMIVDPVETEIEDFLDDVLPSPMPIPRVQRTAFWLSKLTPAGDPDPTFGVNGTVTVPLDGASNGLADIAVAPDGSIIAAGRTDGDPRPGMIVARFLPSGELDPMFGPGGFVALRTGSDRDASATGVALTRSGSIVVSGFAIAGIGDNFLDARAVVVRLRPDGTLDPAFGKAGVTRFQIGRSSLGMDVALTPSGAVYVAGMTQIQFHFFTSFRSTVYSLTSSGKLVRGFGIGGAGELPPEVIYAGAIALHKGKPLVIGSALGGTTGQICSGTFCFFAGVPDFDFMLVRLRA